MSPLAFRDARPVDEARRPRRGPGRFERVVTIVSACAIALLIAVDVVRTAPPDAPVVEVTFDVAPPDDWLPAPKAADERWSADDSAHGTRPDATH